MSTSSDAHLPCHTPPFLLYFLYFCFCFFLANWWVPRGFLTTFYPPISGIYTPLHRPDYLNKSILTRQQRNYGNNHPRPWVPFWAFAPIPPNRQHSVTSFFSSRKRKYDNSKEQTDSVSLPGPSLVLKLTFLNLLQHRLPEYVPTNAPRRRLPGVQ